MIPSSLEKANYEAIRLGKRSGHKGEEAVNTCCQQFHVSMTKAQYLEASL